VFNPDELELIESALANNNIALEPSELNDLLEMASGVADELLSEGLDGGEFDEGEGQI